LAARGAGAAEDRASPWFETEHGAVRLIAATAGTGSGGTVTLGLEFRMAPGWKIYWRSPGDAGYPPSVDWTGSENLVGATIAWPAPHRFSLFGLDTMGYEGEVVLPVEARLEQPGETLRLRAAVDWLTCKEICVPYQATLDLTLPAGPAQPTPSAAALAAFAAKVPGDGASVGLVPEAATLVTGRRPVLELRVRAAPPLGPRPDVFVESPSQGVSFGAPSLGRPDGDLAVLRLPVEGDAAAIAALADRPVTVTVTDGDGRRAAERGLTVTLGAGTTGGLADLLPSLGLALLGGFILNLMPCVLPVLSIKLLGLVKHAGRPRGAVRAASLATASGVVASFLALAALLIGLKAAGIAVGWGLQFQQPAFLAAMIALLTLFACNLWGFFEIGLPGWAGSLGVVEGAGTAGRSDDNLAGNFATGAFATLLATPCSAPFLGTAVGFALASGPLEILAVFAALGVGLALPYLLVAAMPATARLLPRHPRNRRARLPRNEGNPRYNLRTYGRQRGHGARDHVFRDRARPDLAGVAAEVVGPHLSLCRG
jgi:suppressor for copper-sensitivity B